MKYCLYITWVDGHKDFYNVDSESERDLEIKAMIESKEITEISYCLIYKSGEYGERIKVL